MGKFLTPLKVELIQHEKAGQKAKWRLIEPLIYQSNTVGIVTVPCGFVTDFASVPRVPIAYLLTGGLAHAAAVVHDFLYTAPHRTGSGMTVTRAEADKVLLGAAIDGMRIDGDGFWTAIKNQMFYLRAKIMWIGVRLGGGSHFGE